MWIRRLPWFPTVVFCPWETRSLRFFEALVTAVFIIPGYRPTLWIARITIASRWRANRQAICFANYSHYSYCTFVKYKSPFVQARRTFILNSYTGLHPIINRFAIGGARVARHSPTSWVIRCRHIKCELCSRVATSSKESSR